jgi:predicted DNA-binding transcriptional regulator AlpA
MTDRILSLEEVVAQTPWSKSTLYRVAAEPDSPFWKRGGRWVTTESDLLAWVRSGPKPRRQRISESPMPRPRPSADDTFEARVIELRRAV